MRALIADTLYPDFLASIQFDKSSTYDVELRKVFDWKFGTFDAYSQNLRKLGHECMDVIVNHHELQWMWAEDNYAGQGRRNERILDLQIEKFRPDVLFMQDLSVSLKGNRFNLLAGQLSCPWPGDDIVRCYSVLFTSFPHYVPRISALGVRAIYLPLAFEPSVLNRQPPKLPPPVPGISIGHSTMLFSGNELIGMSPDLYDADRLLPPERDIDISFCGGVGRDSHWKQGTDTLEAVAEAFPTRFQWWGYGVERLPASSALRGCYKGQAFGRDMYSIYRRSKIVINRHGEVAQGFANNLRMYEATGCGAMLLTDNQTDLFAYGEICRYSDAAMAIDMLHYYLDDKDNGMDWREEIAERGQRRTLRDHTYSQRMAVVSQVLTEMLVTA